MDNLTEQPWEGEILYLPAPSGKSAMVERIRAYWHAQVVNGRFPTRHDIEPFDLKDVLPYLSIIEFSSDPFRVKFRLVGTEVARFYGNDVTGKWLDQMPNWSDADMVDTHAVFRRVHDLAAPVYGLSLCQWQDNPDHIFEFGCFPLSDDGRTVTHCLGVDDYTMVAPQSIRVL